jgi:hypothetical protein
LLASERRRGRAAAAEAELSAAVGREEGEGEWRAVRKASFVWVSKPLLDEHDSFTKTGSGQNIRRKR